MGWRCELETASGQYCLIDDLLRLRDNNASFLVLQIIFSIDLSYAVRQKRTNHLEFVMKHFTVYGAKATSVFSCEK